MDRGTAIEHLNALEIRERQLIGADRPYLSRDKAREAAVRNRNNADALAWALRELQAARGRAETYYSPCPEPLQESDEYRCGRCGIRWAVSEEKPACQA
jgi:rubrerythrin